MKKYILFLFLAIPLLQAKGLKVNQTDKDIMFHIFNAEWNIADSLIELQLKKNKNDPKYLFMKAPLWHYTLYLSGGAFSRDTCLALIEKYSQKAIAAAEKLEPTTELKFYIGSAYGYLSRVYGMRREYWNAYWAAKDCRSYLENVLEEDNTYYDAYMGLGVIEYYTGARLTGFMSSIAWLVGMSGDRNLGLSYFHKTMDKGKLFNAEAQFALATIYRFLETDINKAITLMDDIIVRYPKNTFISDNRKRLEIQLDIDKHGMNYILSQKDSLLEKYNIDNAAVLNTIGYGLVNENKLNDALAIFKLNVELFPKVANVYDSLAECYKTRGDHKQSIKYYKLALEKLKSDESLNEEAKTAFKNRVDDELKELNSLLNS